MQDELPLGEAMNAPYIVPFGKLAVFESGRSSRTKSGTAGPDPAAGFRPEQSDRNTKFSRPFRTASGNARISSDSDPKVFTFIPDGRPV